MVVGIFAVSSVDRIPARALVPRLPAQRPLLGSGGAVIAEEVADIRADSGHVLYLVSTVAPVEVHNQSSQLSVSDGSAMVYPASAIGGLITYTSAWAVFEDSLWQPA